MTSGSAASIKRCEWAHTPLGIAYHDAEWGVPVHDDQVLFEPMENAERASGED
jgi:3-methyladenine DNA glycosylase Tag